MVFYYVLYEEMVGPRTLHTGVDIDIAYSTNRIHYDQFLEERFYAKDIDTHDAHQYWMRIIDTGSIEVASGEVNDFFEQLEEIYGHDEYGMGTIQKALIGDREIRAVVLDESQKPFLYLDEEFEMWAEASPDDTSRLYSMMIHCLNAINAMMDFIQKDSNLFEVWYGACGIIYYSIVSCDYAIYELELEDYFDLEEICIHPFYTDLELADYMEAYTLAHHEQWMPIDTYKVFALEYEGLLPDWVATQPFL